MSLTQEEIIRYSRQTIMPELGAEGQLRLKSSSILIVGLGGLGSPAALYLAAAGVGKLGLVDDDSVDVSNLHRQVLYETSQIGQSKARMAGEKLQKLNPHVQCVIHSERLTAQNSRQLFSQYDFILDGADNFATRYLTNDTAFFTEKILISASVLGFEGQISVFDSKTGPCYRCLYPEPPPAGSVPSCAEAGVLGAMPGMMGSLQAIEALKLILGLPTLQSQLLLVEGLEMNVTKLRISKNPDCPLCGVNPKIRELKEENFVCAADSKVKEITHQELEKLMKNQALQLLDVREGSEFSEGKLSYTHHIPLADLEKNYQSLALETPLVIYCRSGSRSLKACQFLTAKGYNVMNLKGGIKARPK